MIDAVWLARVDAALVELETTRGGAVCPIRRVPIDLIAEVVADDLGVTSALAGALVPDQILASAVHALVARYLKEPAARPVPLSTLALEVVEAPGPVM